MASAEDLGATIVAQILRDGKILRANRRQRVNGCRQAGRRRAPERTAGVADGAGVCPDPPGNRKNGEDQCFGEYLGHPGTLDPPRSTNAPR